MSILSSQVRGFLGDVRGNVRDMIPLGLRARLKPARTLPPRSASVWDEEFQSGEWDYLGQEMPRYAVIAGYCGTNAANRRVLDLGCGNGALQPWLERGGYQHYLGLDLSSTAIAQARQRAVNQGTQATVFDVADVDTCEPDDRFDVIVFNEMLYHSRDPARLVSRLRKFLLPNGIYVISLWECKDSWHVWRNCRAKLKVLDEARISHGSHTWDVRLCQPL